jgi:hypothetical protein
MAPFVDEAILHGGLRTVLNLDPPQTILCHLASLEDASALVEDVDSYVLRGMDLAVAYVRVPSLTALISVKTAVKMAFISIKMALKQCRSALKWR